MSTCKSFQLLSMIFHTWASSFLFANGKVPRTQIEQQKNTRSLQWQNVARLASACLCLLYMGQHSGFALLFSGMSRWVSSVNLSSIHQWHLLRGSTKILSEISRPGFFRATPWLEGTDAFSNTQILCEAQNVSRKFVIITHKHSRTMS